MTPCQLSNISSGEGILVTQVLKSIPTVEVMRPHKAVRAKLGAGSVDLLVNGDNLIQEKLRRSSPTHDIPKAEPKTSLLSSLVSIVQMQTFSLVW